METETAIREKHDAFVAAFNQIYLIHADYLKDLKNGPVDLAPYLDRVKKQSEKSSFLKDVVIAEIQKGWPKYGPKTLESVYAQAWALFQKYSLKTNPNRFERDSTWDELLTEAGEKIDLYQDQPIAEFAKQLLIADINYLYCTVRPEREVQPIPSDPIIEAEEHSEPERE